MANPIASNKLQGITPTSYHAPSESSDADVFLRRTPNEYWQIQIPSTASASETIGNSHIDPILRNLLRHDVINRNHIIPRNFNKQMMATLDWCKKATANGDSNAQDVTKLLQPMCNLSNDLQSQRYTVILC